MNKPLIGISGNILICEGRIMPSAYRSYVNHNYITSILKGGGIPVILPLMHNEEDILQQLSMLDGVLLTGGYDVDPFLYGEEIRPYCGTVMPEVDDFTMKLIHAADQLHLPVFGICRGIQILNVAYGGTLYQDLSTEVIGSLKHMQDAPRCQPTQMITTVTGSFINGILGERVRVNSFHHQGIKRIADGFVMTAYADDGVIEAIERKEGSFMAAVQFHPEMMAEYDNPVMIKLFQAFIDKCREFS